MTDVTLNEEPRNVAVVEAPEDDALQARRAQAMQLRLAGASYEQIGQRLGVSKVTAYRDVRALIRDNPTQQQADELREIELRRLDAMLLSHWALAQSDNKHAMTVLRILDRRYRLLGLEAPRRVDVRALVLQLAEEEGVDPELLMEDARLYLEAVKHV